VVTFLEESRDFVGTFVRIQDSVREWMSASWRSTVVKGWRVSECEATLWPSVMRAETSVTGSLVRRWGVLPERQGNRWWRKGGRRRRGACMWTHPVNWPNAVAGPGGQECAVVCGWDPPLSAPACPPSPHTSRLFILHCGKISAPAVSSGSCKVYIPHPHAHVHNTTLSPNSLSHKQLMIDLQHAAQ